jgi:hypothetical protein
MADSGRVVRFTIPAAAPEVEDHALSAADIMSALDGGEPVSREPRGVPSKIEFPRIRDEYLADPAGNTRRGIAPYHRQDELPPNVKADLARALDWKAAAEAKHDEMLEDPMFELYEMVKGAVMDKSGAEMEPVPTIPVHHRGSSSGSVAPAVQFNLDANVDDAYTLGGRTPVTAAPPQTQIDSRGNTTVVQTTEDREAARNLNVQRGFRVVANQPHVSGVQRFPLAFTSAVSTALMDVKTSNYRKFRSITLASFWGNEDAMTLFANLIASIYISRRIREPGKLYKDRDAARRNAEKEDCLDNINALFVVNPRTMRLRNATAEEYSATQLRQTVGKKLASRRR